MQILTREQFRDALRKGLGRAVLHAREHGLAGLEDDVLQACLHTQAYDPQCNAKRAEYLFFLLDLAVDMDFFRVPILQALVEAPSEASEGNNWNDFWDVDQLFDLAVIFAKRGDQEAGRRMYERFDQQRPDDQSLGQDQIIAFDGVRGLLHLADRIGAKLFAEPDHWEDGSLLLQTMEQVGMEVVLGDILAEAEANPNVRTYLDTVERVRLYHEAMRGTPQPDLAEILARVEAAWAGTFGPYTK